MDRFKLEGIVVVVVVQANKVILAKKPIVLRKQKNTHYHFIAKNNEKSLGLPAFCNTMCKNESF